MAATFSDLHTESGLKALDAFLSGKSYISGEQLTKDDVKVYAAVLEKPSGDLYPNASQWYETVSAKLAASFPGKAVGVRVGGQAAAAEAAPASETTEAAAAADDDGDIDLVGDAIEEEKKAAEQRDAAKASSAKKKESGKSSVLMDVKPWDDETDLTKLEEAVRSISFGEHEAAADDDDDDIDLFGEATEEEKKAAEQRDAAKASSPKKKESGKSSVLMDVKPWDDETDLTKLEEAVRSIEMPGLFWGASKLVPVGYGIKKLQIMLTIVDDLVSVDDLIEERLTVEPINEYVQSCDIVAFNKI